ncbi:MAG: phosphonoacetaldehyde reductase [Nanoarchaeota archaeon]
MPQIAYVGKGTVNKLKEILQKHNPINIFLVTGKFSFEKSGAKEALNPILKKYNLIHFYDFDPNPKLEDAKKGIKIFKENNCDFVIAVGGGSAIDTAKLINIFAANDVGKPEDYVNGYEKIENKGVPLVAIPTTSGSGSEATRFASFNLGKIKSSLGTKLIIPNYAIVDSQLTMSLPRYQTACTGMDALAQGIESYWSVYSTEKSKEYANETIKIALNSLREAVNNPTEESKEEMAKASYLSGKAINITMTTACHAISYPLTSYFNIPHGHAAALTLAKLLVYNSKVTEEDVIDKRGVGYVKKTIQEIVDLFGVTSAEEAADKIEELMKKIGLSTKLSEAGVKTEDEIEIVIKNGFNPARVKNNPRKVTEEALRRILDEIR